MDAKTLAENNRLVKMYAGSIAYGTNLPTSDVDFRGIFAANPINLLTPFFPVREYEDTSEEDTKFYELNHFIKLCTDCNPNVVELLWTSDADITFRTPAYDHLRSNRMLMLSSRIAFTTSGYALAQLKRIKGHNKWINAPQPKEPPRQTDFVKLVHNLTESKMFKLNITEFRDGYRLIPYGENIFGLYRVDGYQTFNADFTLNTTYNAIEDEDFFTKAPTYRQILASILFSNPPKLRRKPIAIVKFCKEEYNRAKEMHKNYWTWKTNRNKVRGALEEQFGVDTKHAMHLVRLLRMGIEALRDGEIIVKRPDAEELLNIRNGGWSYEQIVQYAEQVDDEIRNVWYKKTDLPKKPNLKKVAQLLMETQDIVWSGERNA